MARLSRRRGSIKFPKAPVAIPPVEVHVMEGDPMVDEAADLEVVDDDFHVEPPPAKRAGKVKVKLKKKAKRKGRGSL